MGEVIKLPNARMGKPRPDPVVHDAAVRIHRLLAIYLHPNRRTNPDAILKAIMEIMEEDDLCRVAGIERPKAG